MKKFKYRAFALSTTAAMAFVSMSNAVSAQQTAAGQNQLAGNDSATAKSAEGDIVVTAQKRTENVQDVPKQVAVASQTQLTNAGVTRITDLQTVFPTITATAQDQNSKAPGIRGIAPIANSIGVQAQTGIIVDDVPQSTFSTLANELTDVERVEVFAGPQATLSGRNATGGLINFVTRAPSNTPEYDFKLEQTTDQQTRTSAFLTGPLSSTLGYSLSFVYNDWNGNQRNVVNNTRVGGFSTKGVRGKVRWEATDRLTATVTGYYIETDRVTSPFLAGGSIVAGNPASFFTLDGQRRLLDTIYAGLKIGINNRSVYSPDNGAAKTRDRGGTLRLDYDVGDVGTVTSLSSYTHSSQPRTDIFFGQPRDGLVFPVTDVRALTDVNSKYVTQELRLTSPGSGPLTYLMGAIYTNSDLNQPYLRPQLFALNWDRAISIESGAVFGRGTFQFTPADAITAGLRYQHDWQKYSWRFNSVPAGGPSTLSSGKSDYGFFGLEASYKHDFTPDVNAFITYSQSEAGQAYDVEDNATAATGTLSPLASTKVKSVEIGLKSQLFDRRLTFNINAFYTNYNDYQIQTLFLSAADAIPVIRLFAVGKVRSQGVEGNAALKVTPDFRLSVAGSYTDSHIRSFPNAACYSGQTVAQGCVNGTQGDLRGLQLPYSPKWKFTAGADYTLQGNAVDFNLGAFFRYQSAQHFDTLGDPLSNAKGFGTLNLYGGPTWDDGRFSLQFFVNNVFDKRYLAGRGRSTFFSSADGSQTVVNGSFDRSSFRYGGVRAGLKF